MGPRSLDRGKSSVCTSFSPSTTLQWGRDLWIAESGRRLWETLPPARFNGAAIFGSRKGYSHLNYRASRRSFNGAAIFGSRKELEPGHINFKVFASMGPRSLDRGKPPTRSPRSAPPPRFNGAAIFGSRKGVYRMGPEAICRASMGPRSLDRGKTSPQMYPNLDAKCFNGAAIFGSRKDGHDVHGRMGLRASMGPRSLDRGKKSSCISSSVPKVLQWGRDLWIAERANARTVSAEKTALQWGRDLWIAERKRGTPGKTFLGIASMGPRSLDRGKINRPGHAIVEVLLQWGRDLWIAEREELSTCPPLETVGFNGAAIFGSRKEHRLYHIQFSRTCATQCERPPVLPPNPNPTPIVA